MFVSGTDFGSQRGPFISPKMYRDLYKPFHKTAQRLDPRQHELEDVLPLLRQRGRLPRRLHRCGGRHPEPGADFGRGDGPQR